MTEGYENSKLDCIILSHEFINVIPADKKMFIELTESPSTGYYWYYTISNPCVLSLINKTKFNFNKPNIIGGSEQIIWKFKCLRSGECKIHFAYYKSWKQETSPLDEYTYIIKVE